MSKQQVINAVEAVLKGVLANASMYMDDGASRIRILNRYSYLLSAYGIGAASEYFQEQLAAHPDSAADVMDEVFDILSVKFIDELDALAV
jgi:hypothetical protein